MNAVPWYQSKVILSMLAGIVLAGLTKFGPVPDWMTKDSIVDFLLYVLPLIAGIVFRMRSKAFAVTPTKAKADVLNATVAVVKASDAPIAQQAAKSVGGTGPTAFGVIFAIAMTALMVPALVACNRIQSAGSVAAKTENVTLHTLILANYGMQGLDQALLSAHQQHLITPAMASSIRPIKQKASTLLAAASVAPDAATQLSDAQQVQDLIVQIDGVLHPSTTGAK